MRPLPPAAWEHGGADLLLWTVSGVRPMSEVLPDAFGPEDLAPTDGDSHERRTTPSRSSSPSATAAS